MSLLKKASIITTPTAYAEDYLYSIKPAYALGSELVVNGDGSSTTGWGVAYANTTLSINNNNLRATANASGAYGLSQSLSLNTSKKYIITADINVDNASGGTANLRIATNANLSTNATTLSTATGITTTTFTPTASTMYIGIVDTASSSSNYVEISNISVKEVTDADFDFDRNSTGTRVNEDYLIEDVPYNLITYSEDFSVWSKEATVTLTANYGLSPDGTQTSTRMQMDANDSIFRSVSSGNTFSVHIKGTAGETIRLANGGSLTHILTGRWDRISLYDTGNIASLITINTYSSATARDIEIWGAQVVKGDQPKDYLKTTDRLDIPRIDYTNGEPSILLEPSRTNLITYSEDFSQWSALGSPSPTITTNFAISPDGTQNASRYVVNSSSASTRLELGAITVSAASHTFSLYIKNNTGNNSVKLNVYDGSDNNQTFTATDTWQRISYTLTTSATSSCFLSIRTSGDADFLIYGAQLEEGSYATSLIHTSGSAVTRSADVANNAGNSDLFNDSEGVLYCEIKKDTNALDNPFGMITIGDGINNRVQIALVQNSNNFDALVGSSSGIYNTVNPFNYGSYNKIALSYNSSGFKVFHDGTLVGSDSNTISGLNLQELKFRFANNTLYDMYANIKMVAVFKEALSDEELEKLTGYNNHELYMNYYNRLSYLGLAEEYNVESDINNYIL